MLLQALLDITGGQLLTRPAISEFNAVCFETNRVRRGDLFISDDLSTIEESIAKGAYGIISTQPFCVNDHEIAWIQVGDIAHTLIKLMRFWVLKKHISAYLVDLSTFDIMQQMTRDSRILFQKSSLQNLCENIFMSEDSSLLILHDSTLAYGIAPNHHLWQKSSHHFQSHLSLTLPYPASNTQDTLRLPNLLLNELDSAIRFFQMHKITPHPEKIHYTSTFYPIHVNRHLQSIPSAKSEQVIILSELSDESESMIDAMLHLANWGNLCFLCQNSYKEQLNHDYPLLTFQNQEELFAILAAQKFTYAVVFGKDLLHSITFTPRSETTSALF